MIFADLGPLAIEVDGLLNPVAGRRLASVLALLLARVGEVVTPAALVDAVWGAAAPARASQSLESLVWRLRKLLEPERTARQTPSVLRTEEPGYRLAVPPDSVESQLFVAAVESLPALFARRDVEQALEVATAALQRWRGEPYEGVPEADWIGPVRERLIALHTDLNEYRVQALLDTGQPERAVSELVPLLASHPFRERFWAQRMLGLCRSGRQAAALEAFTQVRRVLADELGLEPGPELRALQQKLLDQEPSLDQAQPPAATTAAARVLLPGRRGAIIGRDDDVASVVALLGGAGLVTLTGPGGTGKTRLAVEAAFHARGGFADGVWFVDLTQTVDPGGVATLTANTLGLGPQPHTSTKQLLLDHLAPRRMLLVLDNCEHVLTGARALADQILDHCPDVTLLATSREPLEVAGESRWPVAPLPLTDGNAPVAGARSATATGAAVALFVERLGTQRPDLDLAGPDGVHIRQICAAVGGLPLGIELAAARARVFELDEIAATLATAPAQLTRSGAGPQRQASLLDAVDWSYRLARPDERILHRRLACIAGPVTLEGAAALCGVPPLRPEQAMELLGGLVHRSLVNSTRSSQPGGPTTFTQLVPIRAHAVAGLAETPEREAVERARDDWVIGHVAAAPNDGRPGLADFYDWLDDNEAAVRGTLRSTLLTDPRPAGLTLLAALGSYWFERSRQIEGGQWALVAKDLPDRVQLDEFDASIAGLMHGCMLALNHEAASAEPYLMAGFTALREPPESRLAEAAELLVLTAAFVWVGDMWSLAAEVASAATELGVAADLPHVVLRGQGLLAACELILGDPAAGLAAADRVLDANTVLGNNHAALFAYITKSLASSFTGDPNGALRFSDEILRLQRDMGVHNVGNTLEVRGTLYLGVGRPIEAVRCFAASCAQNMREGRAWPWHPGTDELLEQLRSGLDPTEFQRNWASGERLGLGDPGQLIAEWI